MKKRFFHSIITTITLTYAYLGIMAHRYTLCNHHVIILAQVMVRLVVPHCPHRPSIMMAELLNRCRHLFSRYSH